MENLLNDRSSSSLFSPWALLPHFLSQRLAYHHQVTHQMQAFHSFTTINSQLG